MNFSQIKMLLVLCLLPSTFSNRLYICMHKDVSMSNQNLYKKELIKWHTQIQLQDRRNGITALR